MFDVDKWHKGISEREHSTEHKEKNTILDRSTPQWKAKAKWRKEFSERLQEKFTELKHKRELGIYEPIEKPTSSSGNTDNDKLPRLPNRLANRRKKSHNKRR